MAGCGKTTVGKRLAAELNLPFCDTDAMAENNAGLTVEEIFARFGEEKFRKLETAALAAAVKRLAVISCGGGIILRDENRKLLGNCVTVYLAATSDTLIKHVGIGGGRPLLADNPREKIKRLLAEREPLYRACADFTVHTDNLSADEVMRSAANILQRSNNYGY